MIVDYPFVYTYIAKSASHTLMMKNRVFSIEDRSQTHPHVDTTMTSLGNFQYMIRGRGTMQSFALPGVLSGIIGLVLGSNDSSFGQHDI